MAEIRIIPVSEFNGDATSFLVANGGLFFRPSLCQLGTQPTETFVILDEDGQPYGGFNLQVTSLKGLSAIAQPYLHPHCALFILPPGGGPAARIGRRKKVLEAIARYLKARRETIISLPFPTSWTDLQPLIWEGFQCTVRYTYRTNLKAGLPSEGFTGPLRGHIRKATEAGVTIAHKADSGKLWEILSETAIDQGFKPQREAISRLLHAVEEGEAQLRVAELAGSVMGFAFTVHDEREVYYLLGALSRKSPHRGALPLLLADAMEHAAHQQAEVFDLEGSMVQGVERFFRSFGGELVPYYIATKAPFIVRTLLRLKGKSEF